MIMFNLIICYMSLGIINNINFFIVIIKINTLDLACYLTDKDQISQYI